MTPRAPDEVHGSTPCRLASADAMPDGHVVAISADSHMNGWLENHHRRSSRIADRTIERTTNRTEWEDRARLDGEARGAAADCQLPMGDLLGCWTPLIDRTSQPSRRRGGAPIRSALPIPGRSSPCHTGPSRATQGDAIEAVAPRERPTRGDFRPDLWPRFSQLPLFCWGSAVPRVDERRIFPIN